VKHNKNGLSTCKIYIITFIHNLEEIGLKRKKFYLVDVLGRARE
jgi:hypothetical protein